MKNIPGLFSNPRSRSTSSKARCDCDNNAILRAHQEVRPPPIRISVLVRIIVRVRIPIEAVDVRLIEAFGIRRDEPPRHWVGVPRRHVHEPGLLVLAPAREPDIAGL